jgi:uncharacterized protein YcnI
VRLVRISVAGLLAMVMAVGWAQVASAHVTVNPNTATAGGYAKLTFRVPNEEDAANATKLEVQMPTDAPLASVSVQPHPGWTYSISVGPLPKDKDQLVFKALQTYDNGEVVSWIQTATAGGTAPEHPAPVLKLTAASAVATQATTPASDDDSNGLAIVGIVVGAVGVVLALGALLLNRKRASA